MHTLLFYDPGHFHAALCLKTASARIDSEIHVYATPGPDLAAFLALVEAFNSRAEDPTQWVVGVYEGDDALDRLIDEKRGNIAILAGRNGPKLTAIRRLHDAGLAVLADKPWITDSAALDHLDRVTSGPPLVMDIMTSRHSAPARLRRRITRTPSIFGAFRTDGDQPALEIGSIHHLHKLVNDVPLKRPAWYFDTRVQGDGLVDIQSHMTDQVQWLVAGDERNLDFDRDFVIDRAQRWTTDVPLDLYAACTGESSFPSELQKDIRNGVLRLACNGRIDYRLDGVQARQTAEWRQYEPESGGDLHNTVLRGTGADLVERQDAETGYAHELHLRPVEGDDWEGRLADALAVWQEEFPGLAAETSELGHRLLIPAGLDRGHESHFALVLDRFLDLLESGDWPKSLAARIRARYTLLARARDRASDA